MAKVHTVFVCQACGCQIPKWQGRCNDCGGWNTFEEEKQVTVKEPLSRTLMGTSASRPAPITQIAATAGIRMSTGVGEFDRVLGGGIVPGALMLIGGDPGVGKSTLLTRVAGNLATTEGIVLYVSGEESVHQIKLRASRLDAEHERLLLASETDVAAIAMDIRATKPVAVIIDSIQTMQSSSVESAPGTVSQVRAATSGIAQIARELQVPVFIVGHVTKDGAIAGPRVLEHMVDTVLAFEGDRHSHHRILRAVKNRFGSTDELGIFEMRESGLEGVDNPSGLLLSERAESASGSVVCPVIEGSRSLLVEVQALVSPSPMVTPRRVANGVDRDRLAVVLAVLEKRIGIQLSSSDVYVSVAGGVAVDEPALDMAIALAVASSVTDTIVDPRSVVMGEIGLSGELRSVSQVGKRISEARRLGFTDAIVPAGNQDDIRIPGLRGCKTVADALSAALGHNRNR
jgi:DNA repair protein RadA/Sms